MIKQAGDRGPRNCYDAASAGFCCATFASAAGMRETRRALPRRRGLHVKVDCGRSGSDQIHMQTAGQAGPRGRKAAHTQKRPAGGLRRGADFVVGVTRFELVTSSVSGKRSPPELNARSLVTRCCGCNKG